ncbi:MAG: hypothetical protein JO112_16525, partial [Planctomycetes bacterium]|nr:hypothetical protein [Planctomycetota bacterium]
MLSSLLGFVFSPVEEFWVNELLPVILYALLGQGFLLVGYCWGATHPPCSYAGPWRSQVVLQITIAVTVLVFIAALWFRNDSGLSLSEALADSGAAYAARVEGLQQRTTLPLFSFCRGFVGPVLGLFVPLGIVYRNQMSRAWQVLWGLGTAGMVIDGLLTGAAKGLFDIVLLIPWFLWLSLRQGGVRPTQTARRKPSFLKRCVIIAIALLVLALGINYFASSRQSRYGLSGSDYPPGTTGWSKEQYGIGLPPGLEYTTYMILAYWTGGYCGLAGCLELPF